LAPKKIKIKPPLTLFITSTDKEAQMNNKYLIIMKTLDIKLLTEKRYKIWITISK
jgi:hypothetical protein